MLTVLLLAFALKIENNRVHSIPQKSAVSLMERWCLEIQLQSDDVIDIDGNTDIRMTEDSIYGPFKLIQEPQKNEEIARIRDVIQWLKKDHPSNKGVFVAIVENEECMLGFIEVFNSNIQVNGFMSRPFIEADAHNTARSMLALEFLDMASSVDMNILFLFEEST